MTKESIKSQLIKNGVSNLKQFGYPHCNEGNILTDEVYSAFFAEMLKSNKGVRADVDSVIDDLLSATQQKAA